jgi:hypothetical protein
MEGQLPERNRGVELERLLEHRIAQRTWGRIRRLRVEVTADRVIVHGYAQLYYIKQLALQEVLEALRPVEARTVEIDIEVGLVVHSEARP